VSHRQGAGIILPGVSGTSLPDDATLMQQVAQGDRRAFLSLYDKYAVRVHGLSLRMLRDAMSAEELTQDAFLRLWTRAQTFNPDRGQVLSWLLAITRRLALDRFRLDSRAPPPSESDNPGEDLDRLADESSRTEEARWRSLRFALADLPPEQRLPIELAFYYGLSQREIAEHLRIPLGTVKTRVRLGMDKLRRAWATDPIHSGRR
jgi:RNA polymerase sigma-70 factor (ECF subfamily)